MTSTSAKPLLPLWLKLAYSAFVAVLVPSYWHAYGPTNFLYFCDVALLMTLVALWREDSLFASMPLVGILVVQCRVERAEGSRARDAERRGRPVCHQAVAL